jgi:cytochrome c-type biogenesis protein CcmE
MSVDQELARAVAEAEAEAEGSAPAVAQAASPDAPSKTKNKSSLGLLIGLLVIVAGVLSLVFTSFKGSAIYSVGVDQLLKEQTRYGARAIRVKGMLVKGTLARRDDPCEYRFKLEEKGTVLAVHHPTCDVPDTFRDMPGMDVEVQAEGKMDADGKTFVSDKIVAKCPSKYEMKQKSMAGELAPHAGQAASPLQNFAL